MKHYDLELCTHVPRSFRLAAIEGTFGLTLDEVACERISADLPTLEESWRIGVIVGPSGSGKTSLAKAAFPSGFCHIPSWRANRAMIDDLPQLPVNTLMQLLTSVGLGSPRTWARPFHLLSGGEQSRAQLAYQLASTLTGAKSEVLVVDEFTSTLDRTIARSVAAAMGTCVRRQLSLPKLVVVTCHSDVAAWLSPDWTLTLSDGNSTLNLQRTARPRIRLDVSRAPQSVWQHFAKHHYLSGQLGRSSSCFVARWEGELAAFVAVVPQLGRTGHSRISRVVTLPAYQGFGIGMRLAEYVANQLTERGRTVSITASHPAIIKRCHASPRWQLRSLARTGNHAHHRFHERVIASSLTRPCASFSYVGATGSSQPADPKVEVQS